jgi:hypothetical protein
MKPGGLRGKGMSRPIKIELEEKHQLFLLGKKRCFHCSEIKDLLDFSSHSLGYGGRAPYCRSCFNAMQRLRYLALPRSVRSPRKPSTEERRQIARQSGIRFRIRHPERGRIYRQVRGALKKGILTRPSICSHCGCSRKLHAHHSDYTQPLQVIWVCHNCHADLHLGL